MQVTNTILMIRPFSFGYNHQTAANNYYQHVLDMDIDKVQEYALNEFDNLVSKIRNVGVQVIVIEDKKDNSSPDSIFPNNWVSFHQNGFAALYPMYAENRRRERRKDIFNILTDNFDFIIEGVKDFTNFEKQNSFLEGTGSMVLDRENKLCYVAISPRTSKNVVFRFCKEFGYKKICFVANQNVNGERLAIYHTNVMMCIANNFAIICLDAIDDIKEKENVIMHLKDTGKEIIVITEEQKNRFAGNMLQIMGDQLYLVMSSSAYNSLSKIQIQRIEKHCMIIHSSLDTIESCGGGSARCMMAEIFLPIKL